MYLSCDITAYLFPFTFRWVVAILLSICWKLYRGFRVTSLLMILFYGLAIIIFDDILQGAGVYSAFSWARLLVLRPRGSLLVQTIYIVSGDLLMLVTLTTCSRSVVRHECYIHSRSRLTGSPWHSPDPGGPTASGRHCLAWMCRFRSTECNPSHTHRPRGLADHSDL